MGMFDAAKSLIDSLNDRNVINAEINIEKLKAKKDISALIDILRQADEIIVIVSAQIALGDIGEAALEPLLESLNTQDKKARENISGAIGNIGKPAEERLIGLLEDENYSFRIEAIGALGKIGNERVINILIEILKNNDEQKITRFSAMEALSLVDNEAVVEPVIGLLKDRDSWNRAAAIHILNLTDSRKAEDAFYQAVDDEIVDSSDSTAFDEEMIEVFDL